MVMTTEEEKKLLTSIEVARKMGLFKHTHIRPSVKLQTDHPKIVICVPVGDKDDPDLFSCPSCGHRHFGVTKCEKCDAVHDARLRMRHAGLVPIELLMALYQIVPPLLCSMTLACRKSVLSAQAREEMTYDGMRAGTKYFWYVDDDTIPPPRALYDLHNQMERNPDIAAITGVYTTREDCNEPLIYKEPGQGAWWDFTATPGVLEDIYAAGAGCLMVRAEAIKEVREILGGPWWADEQDFEGSRKMWGHDIRFFRRIHLANETGKTSRQWRTCVAGWVQCTHLDIHRQKAFTLPENAPCFENVNTRGYWNEIWGEEGHQTWRKYRDLYARIAMHVPKHARVLDVGCGIGILLETLIKSKKVDAYGIDISDKAIQLMRDRSIPGEVCDVLEWKYPTYKDPIVVCTETIEHLDNARLEHFVSQIKGAPMALISAPDGEIPAPQGEHQQVFTKDSLRELLLKSFPEVSVERLRRGYGARDGAALLAVCRNGGTRWQAN
jgi:2-polyprenyl-3-methyl-5-hydroxy-6-metoxy-1,4-benzoquinol methylase